MKIVLNPMEVRAEDVRPGVVARIRGNLWMRIEIPPPILSTTAGNYVWFVKLHDGYVGGWDHCEPADIRSTFIVQEADNG